MLTDRSSIVDLRNVRTEECERVERLRREALLQEERARVLAQAQTIQDKRRWQDVVNGVLRVASIVFVVAGSWNVLPTLTGSLSYFMDTEASGSHMTTGFLELSATTSPQVTELSCGGMHDPEVHIQTDGNPATVSASTTALAGSVALCEAIELDVRHHGETLYSGPLTSFSADGILDGTMRFIVSLPDDAGPFADDARCTTSIEFVAVQQRHGGEAGFTDRETVELAFSVDTSSCDSCDEPCDTCGDLYVDIVNDNDATVINIFDISSGTGGNTASSGGTIITGDASSTVLIENSVNVNETVIEVDCCCECEEECGECVSECDNPCGEAEDEPDSEEVAVDEVDEAPEPADEGEEEVSEESELTAEDLAAQIQAELDARLQGAFGNL